MRWLYKLLGFKEYKIYEADDDCIDIINIQGFKTNDYVWLKKSKKVEA